MVNQNVNFWPNCSPTNENGSDSDNMNCPLCSDNSENDMEPTPIPETQNELLTKIQEVGFALTDLNLYLDTHPECTQGLELFKKLAATLKSLKSDYTAKYGPLYARDSDNPAFFQWVKDGYKWPWEL